MGWDGESDWTPLSAADVTDSCDPIILNEHLFNMGIKYYYYKEGEGFAYDWDTPLVAEDVAIPCGLIAKSLFNDKYKLFNNEITSEANQIFIDETGIAWDSDVTYKFGNGKDWKLNPPTQWWDMTDEHFIVWMRTAGLPNFRKLWGRIEDNLTAGTYYVEILNKYNVEDFSGTKSFVLSTTNMLGGRNYFLAVCYIVVGALCIVFAVIFFVAYMRKRSYQNQGSGQASNP